jgi:hypothetical protein
VDGILIYSSTVCFALAAYHANKKVEKLLALGLAFWAAIGLFR